MNTITFLVLIANIICLLPVYAMHVVEYGNTIADQEMLSDQLEKKTHFKNLIFLLSDNENKWMPEDIYTQPEIDFESCVYLVYSFLCSKGISPYAQYDDKKYDNNYKEYKKSNLNLDYVTMLFLSYDILKKYPKLPEKLHYEEYGKLLVEQLKSYPETSAICVLIQEIFIKAQTALTKNKSSNSKKLD